MSDFLGVDNKLLWALGLGAVVAGVVLYVMSEKKKQTSGDSVDGLVFSTPPKKVQNKPAADIPSRHYKARGPSYPRDTTVQKAHVPDEFVPWSVRYSAYSPTDYTAPVVTAQPVWADPDIRKEKCLLQWNALDGDTDRQSHMGTYKVVDGLPRNPVGRTGMTGRGLLGKWGPNHAADPIVTRWKRDSSGKVVKHPETSKPVLQFVSIQRKDSGEWALPGGMVEAGESVSMVLKKEFAEEAMNMLEQTETQKQHTKKVVEDFFKGGTEVYRGYVDDPRNTDNAWMETVAVNFHDETGEGVGKFHLHAGDDAGAVQWADVEGSRHLYASHSDFVKAVAKLHHCHW